jgi:hypothetical protein
MNMNSYLIDEIFANGMKNFEIVAVGVGELLVFPSCYLTLQTSEHQLQSLCRVR